MKKSILILVLVHSVVFCQTFWQRTVPYYGSFNKIIFIGNDTVYGTQNSGFSRSTNNGTSWSSAVIVNYVTDIAAAPNGNIFISENQQKMSRSTNKGVSWTITGTGINETSCTTVMVTSTGTVLTGTSKGIYRSTNNGDSWTKVAGSAEMTGDSSISAMATYDGNTVYAFTRTLTLNPEKGFAFRSTNDGLTWIKGTKSVDTAAILKAKIHPNGTVYVCTGNGIRSSTDGGNSWNTSGFSNGYVADMAFDQSGTIYTTIKINDTTAVLYKSTNNGSTWNSIPTPYNGISEIAVDKQGRLFLSQDQLYRSTDNGSSWNPLPVSYPEIRYFSESPKHVLYVTAGGSAYQNLYRSVDQGQSWSILFTGVVGIPIVGFNGDTLFVGDNYYQSTIFQSFDNGKTFKSLPNNGMTGYVNTIMGTSYQSVLAGTSSGVFRSKDNGKNWVKVSNGSASNLKQAPNGVLYFLRETFGDSFYRSTDSGSTWQQKISGMPNVLARGFVTAPNGNLFCSTESGIFRSTDNGDAWVRIDTQKINKPSGHYIAVNQAGKLFVGGTISGSQNSIFQSTDNGTSWILLSDDFFIIDTQSKVRQLFSSSGGSLFAGSTVGLYHSKNSTFVHRQQENMVEQFSLEQNFPNPFNPTTRIVFSIKTAGLTSLSIYDVLGKEITLLHEFLAAGRYSIDFNAAGKASGLYYYRLKSGMTAQTRKMLYVK